MPSAWAPAPFWLVHILALGYHLSVAQAPRSLLEELDPDLQPTPLDPLVPRSLLEDLDPKLQPIALDPLEFGSPDGWSDRHPVLYLLLLFGSLIVIVGGTLLAALASHNGFWLLAWALAAGIAFVVAAASGSGPRGGLIR